MRSQRIWRFTPGISRRGTSVSMWKLRGSCAWLMFTASTASILWATRDFRALEPLPPDQFMAGFVQLQLAPGVEPPPPPQGPSPQWMATRPAGLRAFIDAFDNGHLDIEALRAFDRPVYFALGSRSNPDYYGRMADRLAAIFPDFSIERFSERHHFDPPHRIEPERLANSLLALWQRGES